MPLIGGVLLHMQSRFLLEDLSNELTEQARLAVLAARACRVARPHSPYLWKTRTLAADVTILTAEGDVLAATRENMDMPDLTPLVSGAVPELHPERGGLDADLADIIVPVKSCPVS